MGWNEPGGNGKDPWGGKGNSPTPPDLDKLLNNFQKKVAAMLGGESGGGDSGQGDKKPNTGFWFASIAIVLLVLWVLLGFFIVDPAWQAVELRFGKYKDTVGPGLHWVPPIVDTVYKVNQQDVDSYFYDSHMLTKDVNIVKVEVNVQYRRADPQAFLFNVANPVESLHQATASALRQVVGDTDLDPVLTDGREQVRMNVQQQLVELMDKYQTGIEIVNVLLAKVEAPAAVKAAFDDAINAEEDEQRFINQAEAYSLSVLPQAEGQVKRLLADARGYKQQVVLNAQGETARYLALLPEYQMAPEVTRERLYLGAIENVLQNSSKVIVDLNNTNNLVYLPIEQLLKQQPRNGKVKELIIDNQNTVTPQPNRTASNTNGSSSSRSAMNRSSRSRDSYISMLNRDNYTGRGN